MFPDWQVKDLVTHGLGDVHVVLWTNADSDEIPTEIEVLCVWPSSDGKTYVKGDKERNSPLSFSIVKRFMSLPEPRRLPDKKRA